MSENGWIQLHRQIRENWIWSDPEKLRAWLDILLEVNHKDNQVPIGNHIITVKRGQKHTSVRKMAVRWGWSRDRVCRFIDLLSEAGMLTSTRTQIGTLLTVVNYDNFQGQPDTNKDTHKDSDKATNKATNKATHKAQTIMNKNVKNEKEREGQAPHTPYAPQEEDIEAYCEKHGIKMNIPRFMAYYGARDWKLGKGLKVTRWEQVEQLITTWQTSNVESSGDPEYVERIPYYQEFDVSEPVQLASVSPFKGTLASEMIKRKRERKVNEG